MSEAAKYFYGIIDSKGDGRLSPPENRISGGIYTIPYQDISALVSDSPKVDCASLSREALARLLLNHQQVIEKIMSLEYAVIPVKLGSFAGDEAEVKAILQKGYALMRDIITKISDKIEIDLAATWCDFAAVLHEIGEDAAIKGLKEELLSIHEGITVDDQIKVGAMIKNVLDKKREDYVFLIQNTLNVMSHEFKVHDLMDDKMVINAAFLIDKDMYKDFERKVEELNIRCGEKLRFRLVGPLPPYSFYTLEIKKLSFEEVDWARKKLNLPSFSSKEEIKKAFRRAAFSFHPDTNPDANLDTADVKKAFNEVTAAYKTLCEYCLAFEQSGQGNEYSFREEKWEENALLVRVKE